MKIHGLVVCVNYADLLALGITRWMDGLASLTIVTDTQDKETPELAAQVNAKCVRTDVFYEHGASFNKGAAMELARANVMPWQDWILFFDADVVPESGWKNRIEGSCKIGHLHGCPRMDARDPLDVDHVGVPVVRDDRLGYGYFQLFHSTDPVVQKTPLVDTHWIHAGNYDSMLLLSWPNPVIEVPLRLWHVGGVSHNWFGRGQRQKFLDMEAERARRGGGWPSIQHERIAAPVSVGHDAKLFIESDGDWIPINDLTDVNLLGKPK